MNAISSKSSKIALTIFSIILLLTSLLPASTASFTQLDPRVFDLQDSKSMGTFKESLRIEFDYTHSVDLIDGETWDIIELTDGQHSIISGQAMVPYKLHSIITSDEIVDVDVEFKNPKILNEIKLAPAPEVYRIGIDNPDPNDPLLVDDDYYTISEFLPENDLEWFKLGGKKIDGQIVWSYSIILYSCKYNPSAEIAYLFQESTLAIEYEEKDEDISGDSGQSKSSRSSRGSEPDEVKYLILTAGYLMDEMQVLADWKTQKGVPAKVYDVEEILDNVSLQGRDDPETIRNFVKWSVDNQKTEYLLLAGDYDRVPPRLTKDPSPYSGIDDGWISSDLYYVCIDEGTTWDKDNDDDFGELGDLDDIIPDLAVGRMAINDGVLMAQRIKEVIEYETEPPTGDWFGHATMAGSNVFKTADGKQQCEYLKGKYLDTVYDSFSDLYEVDNALSQSSLINDFNDGSTLVVYLGHGSSSVWTKNLGYTVLMNYPDVGKLDNGIKKPVITTVSCDTSWFDAPKGNSYGDCIAESYTERINKGAIGYLGSVRTTVGALTQSYYPYAPGLQEDFIRQINRGNLELGSTYVEAMAHYAQSWGHMFAGSSSGEEQACWLEYHLLGEPEMPLWVATPEYFTVEDQTIGDSITITVKNDQNNAVENARVCIWLEDEVYDYLYTDGSGVAKFNAKTNSDEEATLTVTKTGFLPYTSTVQLLDQIPPITSYKITPGEPDGMNGWYVNPPEINLTVNEDNTITYYKWDNGPAMLEYGSPIYAPEGMHTLHFYSVDSSDNIESSNSFSLKLDTTQPNTDMTCDPAEPDGENGWYITVPEVFLEKEPKATTYYHWDSNPFTIYELPINGIVGEHTLYYYSRDDAGHIEPTNKLPLKIDLDTPATAIYLDPELPDGDHNWYASKPYIKFDVDETNDCETYYYWDDDSENPVLYDGTFQSEVEGEHTVNYYTVDEAGNTENEKWLNVDIDTITPETTISFEPNAPTGESNWYKGDTVIITLDSSEPEAKIYYYWDSESSRTIYSQEISAPEGDHTLYFYSVDDAGNRESVHKEMFKIDTITPESSYDIETDSEPNKNNWYLEMPNVELDMDEDGVIYYYMLTDEQSLDDFDTEQLNLMKQTYVAIYPIEGIYSYYFYAVDEAGNVGEFDSFTIKMDLFDPVPEFSADKILLMENDWVLFNANRSHDENPITGYKFVFSEDEETAWLDEPILNHTFEEPGVYEVYLMVKDTSGRISQPSQTVTVTVLEKPEDAPNVLMQEVAGGLPMIFVILIVVVILVIVLVMFIRHRKAKSDWEYDADDEIDDDYVDDDAALPPPGRVIDAEITGYRSSKAIRSRRTGRLSTPPPPPAKLPPSPPSVIRVVKKKKQEREEIIEDDDIDWDSEGEEEDIEEAEDDEEDIDWEEDDEDKKIKLECPKCKKRFETTKGRMRRQTDIFCTHCGAKGGL